MFDWGTFLTRLESDPPYFHSIRPPCPEERIEAVERKLGSMPQPLKELLGHFNGAKLFDATYNFFPISAFPALPSLEWSPEWCIDTFTPLWRDAAPDRQADWAIAMTNYGGLILLDERECVNEWDRSQSCWLFQNMPLGEWIEKVVEEGEATMAEFDPGRANLEY